MTRLAKKSNSERIPYWDNLKGILIFLVVFGHFLWGYMEWGLGGDILYFIYIFHMPAFAFVSGYLSKSDNSRSGQSLMKLAVTYIIFNLALMTVSSAAFGSSFSLLTPSYSAWFLLSLLVWRAAARIIPKSNLFIIISIIVAVLVGFWPDVTNVLAAARTIAFFPFFCIGYMLPADKFQYFLQNRKRLDYGKGLLLVLYTIMISVILLRKFSWLRQSDFLMDSYSSLPDDLIARIVILSLAGLMTAGLVILTPNRPIPLISKWGRNSLFIYVTHRFITFAYMRVFPAITYTDGYVLLALAGALLTTILLSFDTLTLRFNQFINKAVKFLTFTDNDGNKPKNSMRTAITVGLLIICLLLPVLSRIQVSHPVQPVSAEDKTITMDIIHPSMTREQMVELEDAITIAFIGDLILLQDQVRNAYDASTGKYDFTPMFEYAKKYLTEADFAIGVFEGPAAGEEASYTTSNFDDGIPLYLNFPDSFAAAVKASGIDLVTTANNHLLDKGEEGAMRTLDVLDQAGLLHVGSYRNQQEKESVMILESRGVRIAFLAYTYGSNYYNNRYFLEVNPSLTSILVDPSSEYFEEVKTQVQADFKRIRNMDNPPDLIAVLPHMGTQFSHDTDHYQDTWNQIFLEEGADIILGDHAHAVQPVEFRTVTDESGRQKKTIIVNCPGNFANSYVENDGDATAIVEIALNPENKEIICAGIIPMYTHSPYDGNYRALPIYDILEDPGLRGEISRFEMERVKQVYNMITSVMLGTPLTLDQIQERHFLYPEGYIRQTCEPIKIKDEMKNTPFYKLLTESKTVCFIGDSITEGSKNGGYGWFEPCIAAFPEITAYRKAWGGATTRTLLDKSEEISACRADLYVIAIGTNDVRYRDETTCAMDTDSYVQNINKLAEKILAGNPGARFVFISPWLAQYNDPYCKISVAERDSLLVAYGKALQNYCQQNGYVFINPNPSISAILTRYPPSEYLLDHIHPNAAEGIVLYSETVLEN